MNNLGWYQVITTWSKKVGGPLNLLGIVAGVGALGGVAGTKGIEALVASQKKKAIEKEKVAELSKTYTIIKDGVSQLLYRCDFQLSIGTLTVDIT